MEKISIVIPTMRLSEPKRDGKLRKFGPDEECLSVSRLQRCNILACSGGINAYCSEAHFLDGILSFKLKSGRQKKVGRKSLVMREM